MGIIGTGASDVQLMQECLPIVSHLTSFQSTLNLALPMRQENLDKDRSKQAMVSYPQTRHSQKLVGFQFQYNEDVTLEVSEQV